MRRNPLMVSTRNLVGQAATGRMPTVYCTTGLKTPRALHRSPTASTAVKRKVRPHTCPIHQLGLTRASFQPSPCSPSRVTSRNAARSSSPSKPPPPPEPRPTHTHHFSTQLLQQVLQSLPRLLGPQQGGRAHALRALRQLHAGARDARAPRRASARRGVAVPQSASTKSGNT